jgi:hypothetical protein
MVDLEAVGGAATGGLIAQAIEKPTGRAGEHRTECADCGTATVGRFCHNCGCPSHVHRTLLHLGEELLHGVMHFDSRTWRTLPRLVFRPGTLTREWVYGKRARYVSPLAIFLFTVFVMFMALHYLPAAPIRSVAEQRAAAAAEVAKSAAEVRIQQQKLAAATDEEARAEAAGAIKEAQADQADAQTDLDELRQINGFAAKGDWKENLAEEVRTGKLRFNTGDAGLDAKLKKKALNPELTIYELEQAFYKFSFLLVPISIPFVALLFLWKKGFTLYDHGVFVLYSLTFMSLLIMALAASLRIGGATAAIAWSLAPLIVPAHMFFQLKGAYGLRTASALWRTMFLLVFSSIALALFILAIVWMELA